MIFSHHQVSRRRYPGFTAKAGLAFVILILNACPSISESVYQPTQADLSEAISMYEAGQTEQSIDALERIIDADPTVIRAWEVLGWAYWRQERHSDAIRLWENLRAIEPYSPNAYNALARAYTILDELQKAADNYEASLELDPDQEEERWGLARIYRWLGRIEDARTQLHMLIEESPEREDYRLELARVLLVNREYEKALEAWKRIIERDPESPEAVVSYAEALFHNGMVEKSREHALELIEGHPENLRALKLLADASEYTGSPAEAIPYIKEMINLEPHPRRKQFAQNRLVRLTLSLNRDDPGRFSMEMPISVVRDILEDDPVNVDAHLLLGELLMMNGDLEESVEWFKKTLGELNPSNQRAHRGLFEVYLAKHDYDKAMEQYRHIEAFNPYDPYLHYRRARMESARGRFHRAHQALDELEARGRQGAVATLLYHGLTISDHSEILSVARYREHMETLIDAGFRFITTDQIPEHFEAIEELPSHIRDGSIDLTTAVTFDDARRDSMVYATPIAEEFDIALTMFVPTGYLERGDPFFCDWDELKDYQKTGRWIFPSHLHYAHDLMPVDKEGNLAHPAANRIWIADEDRLETEEEYLRRLDEEYHKSRELIIRNLGRADTINSVAYPFGDVGQETRSNVEDPIGANLERSGDQYEMGFIQTPFGYSVHGDNPLLYQRKEPSRDWGSEEILRQFIGNHPVFLAKRMRAELAAMEGRSRLAQEQLESLEREGYPDFLLEEVLASVHRELGVVRRDRGVRPGMGEYPLFTSPSVGGDAEFFRDNLDQEYYRITAVFGINMFSHLNIEGFAGIGEFKQTTDLNDGDEGLRQVTVDESTYGLRASYTFMNGTVISGEAALRDYSSPADRSEAVGKLETHFKPTLNTDITAHLERDVVPTARSAIEGTTHDLAGIHTSWQAADRWILLGNVLYYSFSDGNDRSHVNLRSLWTLSEKLGWFGGIRYGFTTADEARRDYWSPNNLHRIYAETGIERSILHTYYSLSIRAGAGRESERDDTETSTSIEPSMGINGSVRRRIAEAWELSARASFIKLPNYDELRLTTSMQYRF